MRVRNRSVEEIHIENLSKKRYEYFAMDDPDFVSGKTDEGKYQKEIDELGAEILKYIKLWKWALPFEFIFEELTKLGWAPCLLYDDNGGFAVSGEGMQSIPMDTVQETGTDWISHWVKKDGWFPTIREALNSYLDEDE